MSLKSCLVSLKFLLILLLSRSYGNVISSCLWKWKCKKTAMCGPCTEVFEFMPAFSGKDTGKTPLHNRRPTDGAIRLVESRID